MQLGFVIDHSRCIGCHACTVACKAENDVPVGSFRTWVKYTETGEFPTVRRNFAVLRCNQCTNAPCVTICPVTALEKRPDGIVDVDPAVCIGCKACMQGCPYDALYIHPTHGTAQKCHFCAHRVEQGLAPACAVVCPTEAIIPGDFHDANSVVSGLRAPGTLRARKLEAGTGPNVYYKEVAESGIDPSRTNGAGGYLWAQRVDRSRVEAEHFESLAWGEQTDVARTVYSVDHKRVWGSRITGYLFAKSVSAGLFLVGVADLPPFAGEPQGNLAVLMPLLALVALAVTCLLLVLDLKRPERFYTLLTRPNWDSWLARGTFAIFGYSILLCVWFLLGVLDALPGGALGWALFVPTAVLAVLTAVYTAWLFGQAKARVLWMKRGLAFHLFVQAMLAGSATLLVASTAVDLGADAHATARDVLFLALILHAVLCLLEPASAPRGREREYERTVSLFKRGPFASRHHLGLVLGVALPLVLLALAPLDVVAGALALYGLYVLEDVYVRAGQALPIS